METLVLDKNKSIHKLNYLPPVYYINLDEQIDRRHHVEDHFKYWGINNYTRISAYDGRNDDLSDIIKGRYPENMTSKEVGCTTSHLKAIKHWYDTSDSAYAIIMEDDIDLDVVRCWSFSWTEFMANLPYDWDVVQLAIICTGSIHIKLHKRFVNDFSTACYMINRHHAAKLLKFHEREGKYKLDNGAKPRAVADDLIYNSGNTYSMPIFLYRLELGSSIHPEHIDAIHKGNRESQFNWWQQEGVKYDIKDLMNYDPYLGRISPQET